MRQSHDFLQMRQAARPGAGLWPLPAAQPAASNPQAGLHSFQALHLAIGGRSPAAYAAFLPDEKGSSCLRCSERYETAAIRLIIQRGALSARRVHSCQMMRSTGLAGARLQLASFDKSGPLAKLAAIGCKVAGLPSVICCEPGQWTTR